MVILCQEKYDAAMAFATEIGDTSLSECIESLKRWEQNPKFPVEVMIYADWCAHSFGFCEKYPNGQTGIVGGLIYHGGNNETFSVQLTPTNGWQIHT